MTKTKCLSPLGGLSKHYLEKSVSKKSIIDDPDLGQLKVYPAGYSQPSKIDSINRQITHESLFEIATKLNTEKELFPFIHHEHNILLVSEPDNIYDANAIRIIIVSPKDSILSKLNGKELGYIPKCVSYAISHNIDLISSGSIFKVRTGFYKKYYTTKVVFQYGNKTFSKDVQEDLKRFSDDMFK